MKWERTPLNVASNFGNNADPDKVLATFSAFILVLIISIALIVLLTCAVCELYRKAGVKKCWKAFIPVYNLYLLCKLTWNNVVFIIYLSLGILSIVTYILGLFVCKYCFVIFWILCILTSLLSLVFSYKVCKAFGHGIGWTIGLILLAPVFLPMLAFGKSEYAKAKVSHVAK